jgi:small subunit ribosomal protein S9
MAEKKGRQVDKRERYLGTGRRKTASARVILLPGETGFIVNGKPLAEYIDCERWQEECLAPLVLTDTKDKYGVRVRTAGGGKAGQAGAIQLGVARALVQADAELRKPLRAGGHLTRDPRMVERKKPGLKGARKRPQYSKR